MWTIQKRCCRLPRTCVWKMPLGFGYRCQIQEKLALAVEVTLEGAAGHKLIHEEARGSTLPCLTRTILHQLERASGEGDLWPGRLSRHVATIAVAKRVQDCEFLCRWEVSW